MDTLLDFLIFRHFLAPYALPFFYYLGALGVPFAAWALLVWLRRRFGLLDQAIQSGGEIARRYTRRRDRVALALLFLAAFLFMELLWRLLFEYLIAFLQMREALLMLQQARGLGS
ncbi:MAG: DUF4282 domain-containing protein [Chromatiaceae bacterium]|nr:DUF4282 domain-containing protein [Chromatiaceae bacterium]